jgi:hypothetical protein
MRKETERGGIAFKKACTIDQSESTETDLSLNIYAAPTRTRIGFGLVSQQAGSGGARTRVPPGWRLAIVPVGFDRAS